MCIISILIDKIEILNSIRIHIFSQNKRNQTMSTRWYPIYKRGNPQLRVFTTDFWMKMVRNDQKPTPPANVVTFHCSLEMTAHDIKNYLSKIYKIPVVDVRTEVRLGEFFRDPVKKYVKKKDDYRVAIVTMVCRIAAAATKEKSSFFDPNPLIQSQSYSLLFQFRKKRRINA